MERMETEEDESPSPLISPARMRANSDAGGSPLSVGKKPSLLGRLSLGLSFKLNKMQVDEGEATNQENYFVEDKSPGLPPKNDHPVVVLNEESGEENDEIRKPEHQIKYERDMEKIKQRGQKER
jgi:hypothetical protein